MLVGGWLNLCNEYLDSANKDNWERGGMYTRSDTLLRLGSGIQNALSECISNKGQCRKCGGSSRTCRCHFAFSARWSKAKLVMGPMNRTTPVWSGRHKGKRYSKGELWDVWVQINNMKVELLRVRVRISGSK